MPILDYAEVCWAPAMERVRERSLVSKEQGTASLPIKEVEIAPGWENRLHTHPVEVSMQVMAGPFRPWSGTRSGP